MKLLKLFTYALVITLFYSCEKNDVTLNDSLTEIESKSPIFIDLGNTMQSIKINHSSQPLSRSQKSSQGLKKYNVVLYMAEYITAGNTEEMGNIVFFKDLGNKQLDGDFVPGLDLDGKSDISYYVDDNRPSNDLSSSETNNAIDRSMSTWDNVTCSELGLYEIPFDGRNTGFISAILGLGGSFDYVADVVHNGWDVALFEAIWGPESNVLAATFTIVFTDENGNLIDLDNNGKYDVALREIYYNDEFSWNDGSTYDVETIALHEAGHGLSQGHFGKAFVSGVSGNGPIKLHFSPRAVMNAAYSGVQTSIGKTDNAGHCSNWAEWPKN